MRSELGPGIVKPRVGGANRSVGERKGEEKEEEEGVEPARKVQGYGAGNGIGA